MTALDTLDSLWRAILGTALASLLSVLIIFAIAVLWTLWRNCSIVKYVYNHRRAICMFFVLGLLVPVPLLLFKSTLLLVYAREVLASVVLIVSASTTLKVLAQVDQNKAKEGEQLVSWKKWQEGDVTGWHELWEEVCFGSKLRPGVRRAVRKELQRVHQGRPRFQSWPSSNGKYEEQLRLLLLSPREVGELSLDEQVPKKEVASPGYVHSDDFASHIAVRAHSVV